MRLPTIVACALMTVLVGCGGTKKEAAAPDSDPWAGYKGTYAGPVEAKNSPTTTSAKTASAPPPASEAKTMSSPAAATADTTPAPAPATKAAKKPAAKKKKAKKAAANADGT